MTQKFLNGWIPEQQGDTLSAWRSLATEYNEHDERLTTDQPIVVDWENFEPRVQKQKAIRDSLRNQGFNFWPWEIAKKIGVAYPDFSQGNRGSCAGCATKHAVEASSLISIADGYPNNYREFNPYYTWDLGKRDSGYGGEGATLSSMLTCANKRGMFPVADFGTYEEALNNPRDYTSEAFAVTGKYQVGACYLGDYQGEELARIIFNCCAAGFPISFGNSVAVDQEVRYRGKIKTAVIRGGWMHATARVAYRKEPDGTEYIAHKGSWGSYWERGEEGEPASVVWEDFDTFCQECSGRYVDAFAITLVENGESQDASTSFAPTLI